MNNIKQDQRCIDAFSNPEDDDAISAMTLQEISDGVDVPLLSEAVHHVHEIGEDVPEDFDLRCIKNVIPTISIYHPLTWR